jgi:hypothetical protein
MNISKKAHIHTLTAIVGLLAALPAIQFASTNILKYVLGWLPNLEIMPFPPLLLIGGSLIAILLNAWSVLEFRLVRESEVNWLMFGIRKRGWNLAVLIIACGFLAILTAYVIVENLAHELGG